MSLHERSWSGQDLLLDAEHLGRCWVDLGKGLPLQSGDFHRRLLPDVVRGVSTVQLVLVAARGRVAVVELGTASRSGRAALGCATMELARGSKHQHGRAQV